jgi:lipopolysaccharide export system protein LptC
MRMTCPAAVVLAALAMGCGGAAPRETTPVPPELKLEGVRFRVYRGDTLRAFGEAEVASLRRDSTELRASRVEAVLPRPGAAVHVTAPTGEGTLATREFQASGGVVVSRGSDAARTERARYHQDPDGQGDRVVGDDPVEVAGRGYRLTGRGFTLDPADGSIVVRGGARLLAGLHADPVPGARPASGAGRGP